MRASFDYGCIAYMSAADSHLKKLMLRACSGAFKTSPISAIHISMCLRRYKHMLTYWFNLKGRSSFHPGMLNTILYVFDGYGILKQ